MVDDLEVVAGQLGDRVGVEVEQRSLPAHAERVGSETGRPGPLTEHVERGPQILRWEHGQALDVCLVVDLVDDEPTVVRVGLAHRLDRGRTGFPARLARFSRRHRTRAHRAGRHRRPVVLGHDRVVGEPAVNRSASRPIASSTSSARMKTFTSPPSSTASFDGRHVRSSTHSSNRACAASTSSTSNCSMSVVSPVALSPRPTAM